MGVVINAFFCASTISAPETKPKHVNHMYSLARGLLQCHLRVIQVKRIIREPGAVRVFARHHKRSFAPDRQRTFKTASSLGIKIKHTKDKCIAWVSDWYYIVGYDWLIDRSSVPLIHGLLGSFFLNCIKFGRRCAIDGGALLMWVVHEWLIGPQTGVEKEREKKKRIYKNNVDNVFDPCWWLLCVYLLRVGAVVGGVLER